MYNSVKLSPTLTIFCFYSKRAYSLLEIIPLHSSTVFKRHSMAVTIFLQCWNWITTTLISSPFPFKLRKFSKIFSLPFNWIAHISSFVYALISSLKSMITCNINQECFHGKYHSISFHFYYHYKNSNEKASFCIFPIFDRYWCTLKVYSFCYLGIRTSEILWFYSKCNHK